MSRFVIWRLTTVMRTKALLGVVLAAAASGLEAKADTYECSDKQNDSKLIFKFDPSDLDGEVTVIHLKKDGSREVEKGFGSELHGNFVFFTRSSSAPNPTDLIPQRAYWTSVHSLKNQSELNSYFTMDEFGLVGVDNKAICTRR